MQIQPASLAHYFRHFRAPERTVRDDDNIEIAEHGRNGAIVRIVHNTLSARGNVRHRALTALKVLLGTEHNNPDNLLHEALVMHGHVTHWATRFPLFVRSYGLLFDDNAALSAIVQRWRSIQKKKPHMSGGQSPVHDSLHAGSPFQYGGVTMIAENPPIQDPPPLYDTVAKLLHQDPINPMTADTLRKAIEHPRRLVLHFEWVDHARTMDEFLQDMQENDFQMRLYFWKYDCANLLFQLYAPLFALRRSFTHYDAHLHNVLVEEIPGKQYVTLVYHFHGKEVRVGTRFIVRLVDYGRAHTPNINRLATTLCSVAGPDGRCGQGSGFMAINQSEHKARAEHNFITPRRVNQSHDLRAVAVIRNMLLGRKSKETSQDREEFDSDQFLGAKVRDAIRRVQYQYEFGTPEVLQPSAKNARAITCVSHMFHELWSYCSAPEYATHLQMLGQTSESTGTFHIYLEGDRPFVFDKVKKK